jgi:hypothetical protein
MYCRISFFSWLCGPFFGILPPTQWATRGQCWHESWFNEEKGTLELRLLNTCVSYHPFCPKLTHCGSLPHTTHASQLFATFLSFQVYLPAVGIWNLLEKGFFKKAILRLGGMSQALEHLLCKKCKALGLNPSTTHTHTHTHTQKWLSGFLREHG